jgi:hypothetical protein
MRCGLGAAGVRACSVPRDPSRVLSGLQQPRRLPALHGVPECIGAHMACPVDPLQLRFIHWRSYGLPSRSSAAAIHARERRAGRQKVVDRPGS